MDFLNSAVEWLGLHAAAISSVLSVVWLVLAKLISTEAAEGIKKVIVAAPDLVSKLLLGVAKLVQVVAEILANAIKSDGLLGKK